MAQPSKARGRKQQDIKNDYEGFVNKFKPRHTTDSCNTPDYIYSRLLQYLKDKGYITPDQPIIRPFWPDADYTQLDQYPDGSIVVDNPPFSILAQIITYYQEHNITYFLFAPGLTIFNYLNPEKYRATAIIIDLAVTYQNGAKVQTAFITNHPKLAPYAAITAPDLYRALNSAQQNALQQAHTELPKYTYPDQVVTACRLHHIAHQIPLQLPRAATAFIRTLDAQRPLKKNIYGSSLLISNPLAAQLRTAQLRAAQLRAAQLKEQDLDAAKIRLINGVPTYTFHLSPREQRIIESLEH